MKTVLILALLTGPASAQAVWTTTTGLRTVAMCEANGDRWYEVGDVCHSDKTLRRTPTSVIGDGSTVMTSAAAVAKCQDGWTLVMDSGMRPMCAHELRRPD